MSELYVYEEDDPVIDIDIEYNGKEITKMSKEIIKENKQLTAIYKESIEKECIENVDKKKLINNKIK